LERFKKVIAKVWDLCKTERQAIILLVSNNIYPTYFTK